MSQRGKSRFRQNAITCLLAASSLEDAATQAGISKRTLLRWLADEDFRQQYMAAKADVLKMATGILAGNATAAANTLEKIFSANPQPHQGARVAAASATLRLALDAFALESLDERIRALENQRADD